MFLRFLQWLGHFRPYFNIYGDDGSLYMGRWWIIGGSGSRDARTPEERGWKGGRLDALIGKLFALRLHHIAREDRTRDHHTHPAGFVSLVVKGWYRERRPFDQAQPAARDAELGYHFDTVRKPWSLAYRKASDRHTIVEVSEGGAWTLVLWFRKSGTWGFCTPNGFANWRDPVALGPNILPSGTTNRPMAMWMLPHYIPLAEGIYECRFTSGERITLRWRAGAWSCPDVRWMTGWRGCYSDT